MNKSELRKRMAKVVNRLSGCEKREQSEAVFKKLVLHPKYVGAKRLSIYLSTENEIDTKPILRQALEVNDKQCFIPFVRKTKLQDDDKYKTRMLMVQLKSLQDYENLPVNNYGIKEPEDPLSGDNPLKVAVPRSDGDDNLDLIIVPGVAFAKDGRRLGHGKGYYDEFLSHWSSVLPETERPYTVGLAFGKQLVVDPLASEGHDFRLDEVLYA